MLTIAIVAVYVSVCDVSQYQRSAMAGVAGGSWRVA